MTLDTPTADKWTSLVLFALGLAMLIGGYTMERLEIRHIHPASIPGLVPMILGAAMMLCAALLFWSTRKNQSDEDTASDTASVANLAFATFYSIVFALALVGSMPFALASAIYIAVFYLHFTWKEGVGNQQATLGRRVGHLAFGIGFAGVSAYGIASLFQYGFLVRLP